MSNELLMSLLPQLWLMG